MWFLGGFFVWNNYVLFTIISHLAAVFANVNPGKHILIATIGLKKDVLCKIKTFSTLFMLLKMRQVPWGGFKEHNCWKYDIV